MRKNKILNTDKASSISVNNTQVNNSGIYYGKVVSVDDPLNEGRIKVDLAGFDMGNKAKCRDDLKIDKPETYPKRVQGNGGASSINSVSRPDLAYSTDAIPITNKTQAEALTNRPTSTGTRILTNNSCTEIPYAVPLLPKHLQVLPKVGEMCMVIVENNNSPQLNRYWIGPLMADKSKISYEASRTGGGLLNKNLISSIPPKQNDIREGRSLRKKGDFTGGFPEKFDVSIMGRNNADIVLPTRVSQEDGPDRVNSGGEVLIRAGKFAFNSTGELSNNETNPGFLRIKVIESSRPENSLTHSMLYSDYISLVSYKNSDGSAGNPVIKRINPVLKKDSDLLNFHNALQPLVRGNELIKFLELIKNYVQNHNHPYHKHKATNANSKEEIDKFVLTDILSPNIRIN